MINTTKQILILLGGNWHDFEGFAAHTGPLLEKAGYPVTLSYDMEELCSLDDYSLLLMYTCLGGTSEKSPPGPTEKQTEVLVEWVQKGGAVIAAHGATVMGQTNPALRRLMGGVFISHPKATEFTIYPCYPDHPITKEIRAFTVFDELYQQETDPGRLLMAALYKEVVYPMVWVREEGKGRIVHLAMGHDKQVWVLEEYRKLLIRSVDWAVGNPA